MLATCCLNGSLIDVYMCVNYINDYICVFIVDSGHSCFTDVL